MWGNIRVGGEGRRRGRALNMDVIRWWACLEENYAQKSKGNKSKRYLTAPWQHFDLIGRLYIKMHWTICLDQSCIKHLNHSLIKLYGLHYWKYTKVEAMTPSPPIPPTPPSSPPPPGPPKSYMYTYMTGCCCTLGHAVKTLYIGQFLRILSGN